MRRNHPLWPSEHVAEPLGLDSTLSHPRACELRQAEDDRSVLPQFPEQPLLPHHCFVGDEEVRMPNSRCSPSRSFGPCACTEISSPVVGSSLAHRTFSTDNARVPGNEFIRRVKALGKQRGVMVALDASRGKGSHQTLYFGSAFTVVRNLKDELKTGTLHAMCSRIGIGASDL